MTWREPRPCRECRRPMLPFGRKCPPGVLRAGARGQCSACYSRASKRSRVQPRGLRRSTGAPQRPVDWVVVDRLIASGGKDLIPTADELHVAIVRLSRYQLSAREIALRLFITTRTVQRHRAAERARQHSLGAAA